ncbi:replication factor C subunit 1 [Chelonus insularis]|uniref:replication factor C subunit 1 n=1 Tax=Chelonus insularis TaxID=460826 RepID=UPI00158C91A9|nr:replication factor C subunit 1 [Chelonus insularis]
MSQDIRSFFKSSSMSKSLNAKPSKKTSKPAISSDEDEPRGLGSNSSLKMKEKVSKKSKKHVLSDSEDEEFSKKSKTTSQSPVKKQTKNKELKAVSIDNMFAKIPIKRTKVVDTSADTSIKEAEFHDDDEFEDTLKQINIDKIDSIFAKNDEKKTNGKRKQINEDEETPPKKIKLSKDEKEKSPKKAKEKASKISEESYKVVVEKKKPKEKKEEEKEIDPYEENIVKKKQHAANYQKYLHRGGARNPGSKEIPEGAPNCLAGLSFVITGVLESLEREQADELIKQYGGRVVAAVSKKTSYLIVGDEAGTSKLTKADSLGIKKITEDDLLDLIRTKPQGKASDVIPTKNKRNKSPRGQQDMSPPTTKVSSPEKSPVKKDKDETKKCSESQVNCKTELSRSFEKKSPQKKEKPVISKTPPLSKPSSSFEKNVSRLDSGLPPSPPIGEAEALVEKYRPKTMKQIIGQHTDKSCANKLYTWLMNWNKNQHGKVKPTRPSPWAKNDDGAFFKAALMSGPPGVGKTTTAQVVCKELGFDLVEFNASDTRSKRLLKEDVSTLLSNTSVKGYFTSGGPSKTSTKHVLLMDEVDGMAGNEDRGGLQELINLIKATDVPIICICNDRNNPKMRTLANYTFDLRFQKPKIEQIKGAMKSLCCKENINISTDNLERLIQSTNFDIRQVINHLAMLRSDSSRIEGNNNERISEKINKDLKIGPWDVCRKVFSAEEHKTMSIHDKSDLFFHDYNIASLFVQENYLSVVPKAPRSELLSRVAEAAESLAFGDIVENTIRRGGGWSLLPVQAAFSSVIPGSVMSGYITSQINFPSWLGRNSKRMKFDRLLQEITVHTRLVTGASKEAINLDYLIPLRDSVVRPLIKYGNEGVDAAVNTMNHYHLLRDDLDGLIETSLWPGQKDPLQLIDSKTKAAFTRAYNKHAITAFAISAGSKKKNTQASQDEGFGEDLDNEGDDVESDKDEEDLEVDRMIKAKKPTEKKSAAEKNTASTSKETSRGRGKSATKRGRGRGK